jgi:hypothetical protein
MEMVVDSSLAEVMGELYAVQFCKKVGFFFFFEGDANTVVKEINSSPYSPPFFFFFFFFFFFLYIYIYLKLTNSLNLSMMRCKASDW